MEQHALEQGSAAWLAYRANHRNASDAPAMMGVSPYKTRSQLLHEIHTGLAPDIDARTQARFDDGHRFEALARPRAEELVGEGLYPIVGSLGNLSASFDGLTICDDVVWEHKTLNDSLRASIRQQGGNANDFLAPAYRIQLEQQLMVSEADRALFLATVWDGDVLVEEQHCWYTPDLTLRAEIIAGWEQFEIDLAAYVPVTHPDKAVADVIMALPALVVQTRGEVVTSNLPTFKQAAEHFIMRIKTDLKTDEDFANAEATVKFCESAEKNLELTKAAVLSQAATIDDVMRTIDNIADQLRTKRLALNKLVDKRKLEIKETILSTAKLAFVAHVAALEAEITPLRLQVAAPDFAGAMKNKRTLVSLNDAVDTLLASAKIATSATAADYRIKQAWCKENAAGFGFLFMDMATIIVKPLDDFQLVVTTRIGEHQRAEAAKAEALRTKIAEEERVKAEKAATEKARLAKVEEDRLAEVAAAAERARVAADTKRQLEEQAATIAAARAAETPTPTAALAIVPASAAPEVARTAAFYGEKPAAPARVAELQAMADQLLADGAATAKAERATGLPAGSLRQSAPADMFDASTGPSDLDIIDFGAQFDMDVDELLPRLERFIVDARAGRLLVAA